MAGTSGLPGRWGTKSRSLRQLADHHCPPVTLFLLFQRQFVAALLQGAVKG